MLNEIIWTLQFIVGSLFSLILLLPVYGIILPVVIDIMNSDD